MAKTATIRARIEPRIDLAIPNAVTLETFAAADRGEDLVRCEDLEDMFEKLEI